MLLSCYSNPEIGTLWESKGVSVWECQVKIGAVWLCLECEPPFVQCEHCKAISKMVTMGRGEAAQQIAGESPECRSLSIAAASGAVDASSVAGGEGTSRPKGVPQTEDYGTANPGEWEAMLKAGAVSSPPSVSSAPQKQKRKRKAADPNKPNPWVERQRQERAEQAARLASYRAVDAIPDTELHPALIDQPDDLPFD